MAADHSYRMTAPQALVQRNALFAMSYDVPVILTNHRGNSKGPVRVVERVTRLDLRMGTTVGVKLETGETLHLADVAAIRSAR